MKTEHWKIEIIRNCIKIMDKEKEKGKITRGEKHDAERTIRFYKLGEEFMKGQVLEIIEEKIKESDRKATEHCFKRGKMCPECWERKQPLMKLQAVISGGEEQ